MALIGLDENNKPFEIIGYCDDLKWELNGLSFSNDMLYPSGATHFWSLDANFEVVYCTSTTLIRLVAENKRPKPNLEDKCGIQCKGIKK